MVKHWIVGISLLAASSLSAQDDLLGDMPSEPLKTPVNFAFKTTRVVNLQSVETLGMGVFDFKIQHRFGALNSGASNAFGLDLATIRIGGEYGLTPKVTLGLGRSPVEKTVDGYAKIKWVQQMRGGGSPISVLTVASAAYRNQNYTADPSTVERLAYVGQVIVGRKFSEKLSVQVVPSVVHYNWVNVAVPNTQFALGLGMRRKLTMRSSLNLEWIPVLSDKGTFYNSFSIGMDVETGGHVFQMGFTNSIGLSENLFLTRNTTQWNNAGIRFGFNMSRVFTLIDPRD
ncbi:MAG: DUF5777 family beta-barrel protein [Bacteroidetes bacterium]|nr:DUF5777 family beta-barrel protein [Bacteroidota bacterium]MDA0942956.1 DUF5777 family beta-barrel protein [Bacteroidota bacterium]MDA1111672.1 DUF5777 family beta-barrel protein [Bacteroidota bacterium]